MAAYVEVPIGSGADGIIFEVRPADLGSNVDLVSGGDGQQLARATRVVGSSLDPIQSLLCAVVQKLGDSDPAPDEVKVEVSVRFAGELGFVVAKGSAEASLVISATWSPPDRASRARSERGT